MNDWWNYLEHSAKGGHWKEHKYVKIIDGVYYYPEGYMNGKYALPDGEKNNNSGSSNLPKGWTKKLYQELDEQFERNIKSDPDFLGGNRANLFDPNSDSYQDIRITLAEFAGINADKLNLSDEELENMREKLYKHYSGESSDSKSSKSSSETLSGKQKLTEEELDQLANDVIRGDYGNGQERKDKLGKYYQEIQSRVNEKLKGSGRKFSNKLSSKSNTGANVKELAKNGNTLADGLSEYNRRKKVEKKFKSKQVKHAASGYTYFEDNYLMHYGTPRHSGRYPWGSGAEPFQRLARKHDEWVANRAAKNRAKTAEKDEREKRKYDSDHRHILSDAELTSKINRLKKEKELKQLTNEEMREGQQFVKGIMTDVVKKSATVAITGAALYGAKALITKKFDTWEFANAMFNGGAKKK